MTAPCAPPRIERLRRLGAADRAQLVDVLLDCVAGGASVSFMADLSQERASAFWTEVGTACERGERALLVARQDERIVGTVHLVLAQPDNQPHRADLCKLLVHRAARGRGVAEALMREVEAIARASGKTLLVLDTASDTAARLYARLGWVECGAVPGYALLPDGTPCGTTWFYRRLD